MQNWKKSSAPAWGAVSLLCLRKGRRLAGLESKCLHMNQKSQRLMVAHEVPERVPVVHHGGPSAPRYSPRAHLCPGTAPAHLYPAPLLSPSPCSEYSSLLHLHISEGKVPPAHAGTFGFCVLRPPRAPCSRAQLSAPATVTASCCIPSAHQTQNIEALKPREFNEVYKV